MYQLIGIINGFILFTLAVLHFYWGAGGTWGFEQALPTNLEGKRMLNPGWVSSVIVGIGLLSFAAIQLLRANIFQLDKFTFIPRYGIWVVALIFLFRAVGDFKYVGFFKTVEGTDFSRMDTLYYSPLCMLISLLSFYLAIFK